MEKQNPCLPNRQEDELLTHYLLRRLKEEGLPLAPVWEPLEGHGNSGKIVIRSNLLSFRDGQTVDSYLEVSVDKLLSPYISNLSFPCLPFFRQPTVFDVEERIYIEIPGIGGDAFAFEFNSGTSLMRELDFSGLEDLLKRTRPSPALVPPFLSKYMNYAMKCPNLSMAFSTEQQIPESPTRVIEDMVAYFIPLARYVGIVPTNNADD